MNFDRLTSDYFSKIRERTQKSAKKIKANPLPSVLGRVVPDEEDLVIGTGRRVEVAVLFLDISGFSQRLSNTSEEQGLLLKGLNLFFTEMVRTVEDYGGTVEKNTGDGLMAYFET